VGKYKSGEFATPIVRIIVRLTRDLPIRSAATPVGQCSPSAGFPARRIHSFERARSSEPEADQQNQDKRGYEESGDRDDFDSHSANGRNVVVDVPVAIKESRVVSRRYLR
jgi:hypothetical protein